MSAFFGGQPIADATSSICSPPYQASLYVVYRSLFATLFGTDGHFSTIEMALDTAHHRDLPQAVIQCPAMLPTILHTISTAASMSTVDGLSQVGRAGHTTWGNGYSDPKMTIIKSFRRCVVGHGGRALSLR